MRKPVHATQHSVLCPGPPARAFGQSQAHAAWRSAHAARAAHAVRLRRHHRGRTARACGGVATGAADGENQGGAAWRCRPGLRGTCCRRWRRRGAAWGHGAAGQGWRCGRCRGCAACDRRAAPPPTAGMRRSHRRSDRKPARVPGEITRGIRVGNTHAVRAVRICDLPGARRTTQIMNPEASRVAAGAGAPPAHAACHHRCAHCGCGDCALSGAGVATGAPEPLQK